ncbi:acyltransferase [Paenibacillus ihbetae]|uniref:Acyltransferase n=1 Tax=Paenibacillus ihbetae TaxID=1870820 RepID=A0A1B2DXW1_9BACL|nr:acyltransferase [Paenibacillus ihbetae]ANY72586.1 acyltransferase [Paenibacillus ihbetae]
MKKIVYLDGLRGLAAFVVVIAHFVQVFMPSVIEGREEIRHFAFEEVLAETPLNLLFNGNFSVCLFFALSGYVLSWRYFRSGDRTILYSAAIRRYFRLAGPAFASVVIAYACMIAGWGMFDDVRGLTGSSMPDPFAADASVLTMVKEGLFHTFFTYGAQYNPVLWTMTYELFGSLFIFAFLLLCGKRRIRFVLYAALVCWLLDSYYLAFVIGVLLSDLQHSGKDRLARVRRPWINAVLLVAGLFFGSYPYIHPAGTLYAVLLWKTSNFDFFVFYHVIGAGLVLTAVLNSSRLQALLGSKWCAYLGKISFSLYLVHFTILCTFGCFLFLQLSAVLPYGINLLITIAVTLAFIMAIAHGFYRLVDAVILDVLSRWNKRMFIGAKRAEKKRGTKPVAAGDQAMD